MNSDSELQRILQRLLAIQWKVDSKRYGSHIVLLREYLRRSVLWAKALGCVDEWPILDLARHIDPSARGSETVLELLRNHLDKGNKPPREMEFLLEMSIHWANLKDNTKTWQFDRPEPYEPIIVMYERGGFFYRDHDAIEVSNVSGIPRHRWQYYDREEPYVEIDQSVLDKIDQLPRNSAN